MPRRRNPPRPRLAIPSPRRRLRLQAKKDAIQRLPSGLKQWVKGVAFFPDAFCWWARRAGREAVRACRGAPPDLVLTSSPQESSHGVGFRLKKQFGCCWVADFRDGWTFEPHRSDACWPLRRALELRAERKVLESANFITAATRPIAEDFDARFPCRGGRIQFLPTGFEEFLPAAEDRDLDVFRMVYMGRFSLSDLSRGIDVFLEGLRRAMAASEPFRSRFRLTVVGDLSLRERTAVKSSPAADRIELMGEQPYEKALRISSGATMLLLVTPPGLRSIATRKIFDYLAARRPVFALAEGNEAARIVAETRVGTCAPPDCPEAVAEGLLRVFALWQDGRLEEEFPCSGNDLYRSEVHFSRVFGKIILPEALERRLIGREAAGRSN